MYTCVYTSRHSGAYSTIQHLHDPHTHTRIYVGTLTTGSSVSTNDTGAFDGCTGLKSIYAHQ